MNYAVTSSSPLTSTKLAAQAWRSWATLDVSKADRSVADTMLPHATQVADRFHLVRVADDRLHTVRCWVQNATLGHRSRKSNALYRTRRLLVIADERLDGSST